MSNRNNQKDEGSKTPQQGNNGGFGIDLTTLGISGCRVFLVLRRQF
jgi:hypothetical protein